MNVKIQDEYKVKDADTSKPGFTKGEIEFIVRDRNGKVVKRWSEPSIIMANNEKSMTIKPKAIKKGI